MKLFVVEVKLVATGRFTSYDVYANTKSEAVRKMRKQVKDEMWFDRHDGKVEYLVQEA